MRSAHSRCPTYLRRSSTTKGITRTITIDAPSSGAPENLHLLICNGLDVKAADSANTYLLGNNMQVEINSNSSALVRSKELILPLQLKPGKNQITLRYQWK